MKKTIIAMTACIGLVCGAVFAQDQGSQQSSASKDSSSASQQGGIQSEAAGAQAAGQAISFDQLPAKVQKAFRDYSQGANLNEIRKETRKGQTVYTASFDKQNLKGKLVASEDGTLLESKEAQEFAIKEELPKLQKSDLQMKDLPDAAQQAIKKQAGQAKIGGLTKTQIGGQTVYHAGFNSEGVHNDLFVDPNGQLIAQSQETDFSINPVNAEKMSLSSAPKAVQDAVKQNVPSSAEISDIDKAQWKGQTVYRVMVDNNGKLSQWVFSQNGKVIPQAEQMNEAAGAEQK